MSRKLSIRQTLPIRQNLPFQNGLCEQLFTALVDKKLARVKTAPVAEKEGALAEDAAGFRK